MRGSRRLASILVAGIAAFAILQLVPYGRDRSAPPDGMRVAWSSAPAERIAQRACYDCHSNQTRWPWYASIAPMSWRIQSHVQEGREKLNFTAFEPGREEMAEAAGEAGETVSKGEMPPSDYLLLHPEARLSAADREVLIQGLDQAFAAYAEHERGAARGAGVPDLAARERREPHEGGATRDEDEVRNDDDD